MVPGSVARLEAAFVIVVWGIVIAIEVYASGAPVFGPSEDSSGNSLSLLHAAIANAVNNIIHKLLVFICLFFW